MKTIKIAFIICASVFMFTSCKNKKLEATQQDVKLYAQYVDSVSSLKLKMADANWEIIEADYNNYKNQATENVSLIEENKLLKNELDNSTLKFEEFKAEVITEKEQEAMVMNKNNLRVTLLGQNNNNNDLSFDWVNKDNILEVYQTFVHTVQMNKDSYSREDWDEIKLLYEAIDTRKNTVEKQGLTSSDNRKIAGLKLKFAPMYTFNRMGAKSEENASAKK
jgi:hypothetical protein